MGGDRPVQDAVEVRADLVRLALAEGVAGGAFLGARLARRGIGGRQQHGDRLARRRFAASVLAPAGALRHGDHVARRLRRLGLEDDL